jgi:hypothetical protein
MKHACFKLTQRILDLVVWENVFLHLLDLSLTLRFTLSNLLTPLILRNGSPGKKLESSIKIFKDGSQCGICNLSDLFHLMIHLVLKSIFQ